MIQIKIKDLATPALERLEKRLEPQRLAAAVGRVFGR